MFRQTGYVIEQLAQAVGHQHQQVEVGLGKVYGRVSGDVRDHGSS